MCRDILLKSSLFKTVSCLRNYLEACVLRNGEVLGKVSDMRYLSSVSVVDGYCENYSKIM